jgi:hypothetical protein
VDGGASFAACERRLFPDVVFCASEWNGVSERSSHRFTIQKNQENMAADCSLNI